MINTDLSRRQEWRAVKGFDNQFTLTFLESGSAFNVASYTFSCNIRKIGATENEIELTEGDGITNGGATGIVTILLDETDSDIVAKGYFYEIVYSVGSFTNRLLQGTFNLIDNYNTDNTNTSLTLNVDLNGTNVNVSVTLAGGDLVTRVQSVTSAATVTPNADEDDGVKITAQAQALTLANPSGTPTEMQGIVIRIKDNGTARAITYGNQYRVIGTTLPTTTVISKTIYLAIVYNSTDTKWDVIGVREEV